MPIHLLHPPVIQGEGTHPLLQIVGGVVVSTAALCSIHGGSVPGPVDNFERPVRLLPSRMRSQRPPFRARHRLVVIHWTSVRTGGRDPLREALHDGGAFPRGLLLPHREGGGGALFFSSSCRRFPPRAPHPEEVDPHPVVAEHRYSSPVDPRIRIAESDHDAPHPRLRERFRAGRSPAVVAARLQGHVGRHRIVPPRLVVVVKDSPEQFGGSALRGVDVQ
mmetsp:Transcript_41268/g.124825  ORF Transcript_41268/g.124825 Transcript_41268/m.124825 type:complete len:220 (-) Transcript_41268:975-1634(-)